MATIEADRETCSGYANCVMTAESYFTLDDDGVVSVTQESVAPGDAAIVREAVESCPVGALSLRD